jgi:hypothetical protein
VRGSGSGFRRRSCQCSTHSPSSPVSMQPVPILRGHLVGSRRYRNLIHAQYISSRGRGPSTGSPARVGARHYGTGERHLVQHRLVLQTVRYLCVHADQGFLRRYKYQLFAACSGFEAHQLVIV